MGRTAIVLEAASTGQVADLYERVIAARDEGEFAATDIVPAARTVLIDGIGPVDAAQVTALARTWTLTEAAHDAGALVEVPVTFDGPDLDEVADLWNTGRDDVVETMLATPFAVAFCGFAPGFAYLSGLGAQRAVPRRRDPRPQVPAGSVGLAGEFAGVYPRQSPGGWQLVGTVREVTLWDASRREPALLAPGVRVRFTA